MAVPAAGVHVADRVGDEAVVGELEIVLLLDQSRVTVTALTQHLHVLHELTLVTQRHAFLMGQKTHIFTKSHLIIDLFIVNKGFFCYSDSLFVFTFGDVVSMFS